MMEGVMPPHRLAEPAHSRRTTLVRRVASVGGACGFGLLAMVSPLAFTAISPAVAAAEPITLISQELALAPDAALSISFRVSTPIDATDSIVIAAYRSVEGRTGLDDVIAGEYGRSVDSVRIDPAALAVAADGTTTVTVASETTTSTPEALRLSSAGLYPITVDIESSDGTLMSELLTFVDRLPIGSSSAGATPDPATTNPATGDGNPLNVAIVASITAPPLIAGDDTPLPVPVNDQIAELSQYPTTVPLSVSISPDVLARLDAKTLDDLQPVLANSALLSQPSIPLDPSAAAAADQADLFTDLLQAGEDLTLQLVGTQPGRSVWLEDQPLTAEGAALLRSLGVTLVALTPETYEQAWLEGGFFGGYTLYSNLRNLQLPDAGVLSTSIIDPQINRYLTDAALAPEMAALYTAAELVVWHRWLEDEFPNTRNSVVLGMSGGGVLGPDRVARLVELANPTGAVNFDHVDAILADTDAQLQGGVPAPILLAPQQPVDLTVRVAPIADIRARQSTISGMLVDDKGRSDLWNRTIRTLESSSITDDQVDATIAELAGQFDAITANLVGPASLKFTMNGQSTDYHASIGNNGNETLLVVIHPTSSQNKIQFPDGDILIEVPPGGLPDVEIPLLAKANGTATILLEVLAPDGTNLGLDANIEAKVNALTGLAQVLTGGMALILATWWVRNLRRSRRARQATAALDNHPARPRAIQPAVITAAAATAVIPAEHSIEPAGVTNTATTSTATITAATVIAHLDTSHLDTSHLDTSHLDESKQTKPSADSAHATATDPDDGGPGSTTLSDS